MKLYLFVVLSFLVILATAKDIHRLKSIKQLKQANQVRKTQKDLFQHRRVKASTVVCIEAESAGSDPRTSETGHVVIQGAPITSTAPDVQKKIKEWEDSTEVGVWPKIEKGKVIEAVKLRLDNPTRVSQHSAPTCGPASIVFWLIVRRPYVYIQFMRSLYETGEYTDDISQFKVTASEKHKGLDVGHDMDPADWISLIALRTSANLVLDVDQFGGAWGITTPGEMTTWTKNILSYANAADTGLLNGDQSETLRKAELAVNGVNGAGSPNEGVASLLVDSTVVKGTDTAIDVPTHWIAYVSGLDISDTEVKFRAFTWGKLCDVVIDKTEWDSKGFGVTTGSAPDEAAP